MGKVTIFSRAVGDGNVAILKLSSACIVSMAFAQGQTALSTRSRDIAILRHVFLLVKIGFPPNDRRRISVDDDSRKRRGFSNCCDG